MRIQSSQSPLPVRRLPPWAGMLCAALLLAACSQEQSNAPAGMGGVGIACGCLRLFLHDFLR
ncbi:MAG: hypothetical protein EOS59_32975, partial [Mesorhizobium sp.]